MTKVAHKVKKIRKHNRGMQLKFPIFIDREHYSCPHSLVKQEVFVSEKHPERTRNAKIAYACTLTEPQHRFDLNGKLVHKDSTGRVWS